MCPNHLSLSSQCHVADKGRSVVPAPLIFTTRRSYASAVLGVVILSIRLSVTRVLCHQPNNVLRIYILIPHEREGNHSSFLTPTVVVGNAPFRLKFVHKVTSPL